jgi:outer membrane protein OmpA-like peptidoglycan-associated protein/tetratricopeptide (TPR) repeat protein
MKKYLITTGLFLCWAVTCLAQKKDADEKYQLYNYIQAIPLYEKYLKDNSTDDDAWHKIAECYKITNRVQDAIRAYKQLATANKATANEYYSLVGMLQIAQQIEEAKQYANTYSTLAPGNKANTLQESLKQYDKLSANADKYTVDNKTATYNYSVSCPMYYKDKIIVTAENAKNDKNKWTGGNYTDVMSTNANFTSIEKFCNNIMTDYDDCAASFTTNGNTMYYTAINKNKSKSGNINTKNMQILQSTLQGDKWENPTTMPFANNEYNFAHATVNDAGTLLVFSSNKPGGKGEMDLYMCSISGGTIGEPRNLTSINTEESEIFPVFVGEYLTFSSKGLVGLGGLDLFKCKYDGTSFSKPENLGAPFNSSYDDFSIISKDNFETGYFSSNRAGNPQQDDVFSYNKKGTTPAPAITAGTKALRILVKDKYTGIVLPYVAVEVKDKGGAVVHKGMTDENGVVIIEDIDCEDYNIQGELNGVTTTKAKMTTAECNEAKGVIEKELLHNDPRFTLRGIVKDANNGQPLEGVKVTLKNEITGATRDQVTKSDGKFFFQLEQKSDFSVVGAKPKWLSSEKGSATTKGLDRSAELYVDLSLRMYAPQKNAVIRLDKIFYDLNKSDLRLLSKQELDRLVQLMNDYPDMKVELSSHTDCRNTSDYNEKLSQRRSESAVSYIINSGIAKTRIVAKGYGETKLINRCADGVQCSEEEHQQNRRTEFMIVECDSCPK